MPHLHRDYDFVVSAFIVHGGKVLLVHHRRYGRWLPIGGHIELDEDPEEALFREIREECGLAVRVLASKPAIAHDGVKPVLTPSYVDVHPIAGRHRHIAFVYFATARRARVRLHRREHREFRWFAARELGDPRFGLTPSIRFYCRRALAKARRAR
jgi:8-oxo-dGTP pyrophosphatase MutT (NUDIX family)